VTCSRRSAISDSLTKLAFQPPLYQKFKKYKIEADTVYISSMHENKLANSKLNLVLNTCKAKLVGPAKIMDNSMHGHHFQQMICNKMSRSVWHKSLIR